MIEVERKFNVTDAAINAILKSGAIQRKKTKIFTDIYYDTKNNCLTENNFWLRQRDIKWELKSPADERSADEKLLNSSYKETEQESEIIKLIFPVLNKYSSTIPNKDEFKSLSNCLLHFGVFSFITIVTQRESYQLGEFIIDIDTTETGFNVGEIELLLHTQDQIKQGSQKIDALITKLGLPLNDKVSGKMGHYLKNYRPEHYKKLFDLKILV